MSRWAKNPVKNFFCEVDLIINRSLCIITISVFPLKLNQSYQNWFRISAALHAISSLLPAVSTTILLFALTKGLRSKRQLEELFIVANLHINKSIDQAKWYYVF